MEDIHIINLFLERSEDAIRQVEVKYEKFCFKIAWNILYNTEDSEECVNDTWLITWNKIPPKTPIRGSRSCGVLLSGDTALVVYNTMDRNMKWAKKMECSMRTWTERMLLKGGYNSRADALIVGQNIKVLLKLLESDGGIKKDLFRPDDIYDQYYYIPICKEGILQLVLLTEKPKREKLKQSLFSKFSIRKEKEYAAYNVCDENGNPTYFVYDLEMRQLCRIKQELLWRPSASIVCMDYQMETIREYLGEKVVIYELSTENVMKYLINDLGE